MSVRTVVVCEAQVPFVRGGAEYHVRELVRHLRLHGYLVDLISLPFKWYPKPEILAHAAAWRLLDLSESDGRSIDLAIASKFPSYFVRHPNKVTWLIHQYRSAYDLCGTEYSDFKHTESDVGLRETLIRLDRQMLTECRHVFTNSKNTATRLEKFNGLRTNALYHPPRLASSLRSGPYGNYLLSVGRLESIKRQELAVSAMRFVDSSIRLVLVGDGTDRERIKKLAGEIGVSDRVELLGAVEDEQLIELYAGALAVVYAPYDEDYGYVTLEAFLSRKPVITGEDSGGILEFVEDEVNGFIRKADPEMFAEAINRLVAKRSLAASFGDAGFEVAQKITWDGVVETLLK